jgi:hypothetical protein
MSMIRCKPSGSITSGARSISVKSSFVVISSPPQSSNAPLQFLHGIYRC